MVGYLQYFIDCFGIVRGTQIYKSIRRQMIEIMKFLYASVEKTINPKRFPNCFQLIGFDFLVADDFRVYLLETNTSPSIHYDPVGVPFKEKMFPRMLEEVFELTIDEYFPPPPGLSSRCEDVKWREGI